MNAGPFGLLVTAAVFGDAGVRDVEMGMDQLLFTSLLGKAEYLGGRFLAALAVDAVVLLAVPLGLVAVEGVGTAVVGGGGGGSRERSSGGGGGGAAGGGAGKGGRGGDYDDFQPPPFGDDDDDLPF
ncbi:MAG: hypothetical protein ABW277_09190 [Longimicrobiaceae bacterium]